MFIIKIPRYLNTRHSFSYEQLLQFMGSAHHSLSKGLYFGQRICTLYSYSLLKILKKQFFKTVCLFTFYTLSVSLIYFKEQILLLNGNDFTSSPLKVLRHVENFIGVPQFFMENHFNFLGIVLIICSLFIT